MILFQTAMPSEYSAVCKRLPRTVVQRLPIEHQVGLRDRRSVYAVRTGMGLESTRRNLRAFVDSIKPSQAGRVVSIGLCGALESSLRVGDAFQVGKCFEQSSHGTRLAGPFMAGASLPLKLPIATLISVPAIVRTKQEKKQLAANSSATICDMETAAVAEVAQQYGLEWFGIRIVSDEADEDLIPSVLSLATCVETGRWGKAMSTLATHPQDIPGLIRLALRMRKLQARLAELASDVLSVA